MSDPNKRSGEVDRLRALIEGLSPFLNSAGRAYCCLPHKEKRKQAQCSLRSQPVRSLLYFRYHEKYDPEYATRERVSEAIEFIEGQLLASRRGPILEQDCPILRCFLRGAQEEEGGTGSAKEILGWLRGVNREHKVLLGAEKLPGSPTAMGKWLARNLLVLQANGIDVTRPRRKSAKRIWSWEKIIRDDDTFDASKEEVSQGVSLSNSKEGNKNRQNDRMTDEQIAELFNKESLA